MTAGAGAGGPHVTLHVWRVARTPRILWRLAADRGRLRSTPGVRFAKLLGTGRDGQFGPGQADPGRFAALVSWDDARAAAGFDATAVARSWRSLAGAYCRLDLAPLASHGTWAGREPFVSREPADRAGLALALTRARLRPSRAVGFWRAIGPVAAGLRGAPGLLAAFGVGEAPIGWQGTLSLWRTSGDLIEFAYRHPAHRAAITATPVRRWYAEELFARFAVLAVAGDRATLGWTGTPDDGATPRTEEPT